MRTRTWLALALVAAAPPAAAQRPEPIADVLHDADGDRVPDRVGQTVTVAGWASADQGAFGSSPADLYVQDGRGGVAVGGGVLADGRRVRAGEPVVVTGTLGFRNGVAMIEPRALERGAGRSRAPAPLPYDAADAEGLEGRLVEVEGTVVGQNDVGAGRALLVSLDDLSLVVVFAFEGQPRPVSFEGLGAGDRVRAVGVAGQYDRLAPYDESYQIYPRSPADVERAGISASAYRWGALGAGVLFLLAFGASVALRAQVRRRVEALRASEARYHTLVDRASDAVFVHGLDGEDAELNRAARAIMGVAEGEAAPPLIGSVAEADRPLARDHMRRLQAVGNARTDLRVVLPDGSERLLEFESQVIDVGGTQRVLSLGRDVGARRDYERGLVEAREAAEETARVKSAFLANMSHEIRTPLTAVIGFADLLMDEVDRDARGLVEAIETGGRRLLATLNSVLDLARLDAHTEALRPVPLDVVGHVEGSATLLRPAAEARGLRLDVVAPDGPVPATLDAGALDRILTNLVGNAVKFTERGGVTVEVGVCPDDAAVVLRVADTGIGISKDFLPSLFDEFRQQSEGDARSHEGSGLGLAITQRLVDLMGGTIATESAPGVGTTFTVTLPRGAAAPPTAPLAETPAAGRGGAANEHAPAPVLRAA
ncbi:PAS domain-containing sensor histidine kinase [Rubrivirga sp. S365]|uniref:histidine kinase n=1 Tax=Rubrivirga litoralis TaxID=3075598 RepID=A0ABU3BQB3_9BACT|nr:MULTISPECIES: PAS domain-containing sensor histidine kinase [unclassified Rubrivirga]MDT0631478.1 PAS domain-containing sensor histidine kinase [Rubrivirga sp. F394]MDT7855540.1 PAS domain-containing sensor histidine kinase [Rubrivirga sp. S365]